MNIKELVRIEDVIQFYGVKLGRHYKGVCPFHKEKDASFSVNTHKQYFKCFGCNESGDVIEFVKKIHNINYQQAVLRLNHDFNLGISNNKPDYRDTIRLKKQRKRRESIKQFEKLTYEFIVLEFKMLEILFEELRPKEFGGVLTEDFKLVINQLNRVEDWLLNRRIGHGT